MTERFKPKLTEAQRREIFDEYVKLETGNIVKSGDAHLLMNDDDVRKAYLG